MIGNRYACLILLLWGTKIDIVLFLSSLLLREVDILPKFHNLHNKNFVSVLIILFFF